MKAKEEENKSSIGKLLKSVTMLLDAYADNMAMVAQGKEPNIVIDEKYTATAMKWINMTKELGEFETLCSGERKKSMVGTGEVSEVENTSMAQGNAFELRSKKVEAKLNGKKV
jgi:hypothetical protein